MIRDFRRRFFVSLLLTLPILALSPLIQEVFGFSFDLPVQEYLLWALSSLVFFYGGWPFLVGGRDEIQRRQPGMMTLIALAISVAYVYSTAVVFGLSGKFFFWELATLIDVMLLGHWIEMASVLGASRALEKLAQLLPDTAHKVEGEEVVDVRTSELAAGDLVLVKAGEKIPADGEVVKGTSYVNESMLTGESVPVKKGPGDGVIGGSVNGDGVLTVRITGTGEDSYLQKVIHLVEEAQRTKSKTQRLADRAAQWLTFIAIGAGSLTFVLWMVFTGDLAAAIERMVTVMVITCPHALGLAVPLVVAVSTSLSARNGLLIRNRTAFENARKISTVVFDKTGTLTEGRFGVAGAAAFVGSEEELLTLAASLERNSEHPVARGIVEEAEKRGLAPLPVEDFSVRKGEGVEGVVNGRRIALLSRRALEEGGYTVPETEGSHIGTLVYVVEEGKVRGAVVLADRIRPESREAVRTLQKKGIRCWMLTGDNRKVAEAVAKELGLDGVFAEVLPHEKQEKVKELQAKGEFVAMTGDGINDAPALAQADVGIAIGSGTDIAAETADIILVHDSPADVAALIEFGRATYRKMVQNLLWATGYNVVAIPLAAGVLYPLTGLLLSPAVGAALMSLSTVIVAVNASFLRVRR
ncbi:copper-translocating P-type ATPase [Spirochaeta thermophila]|nr:copper-translocating P-type ATPase [Spirochaeta thermophila]